MNDGFRLALVVIGTALIGACANHAALDARMNEISRQRSEITAVMHEADRLCDEARAQSLGLHETYGDGSACKKMLDLRLAYSPQLDALRAEEMSLEAQGATGSSGGVNVRGYTRADGTYVAPYTRSSPSRGGGRR